MQVPPCPPSRTQLNSISLTEFFYLGIEFEDLICYNLVMKTQNNINLNSVFFHSLGAFASNNRLQNSLIKLESILKNGSILSRQEQINKNSDNQALSEILERYLNPKWAFNWNGMNHISICQRTSSKNPEIESDAFKEFVIGNTGIGIILSQDIMQFADNNRPKLMDGEFQIKDKVSLEYMLGIFYGGKSNNELLKDIEVAKNLGISQQEIKEFLPHTLTPYQLEIYKSIQELLNKYGYNVPIYSSRDGFEILNIENLLETPELVD